MRLNADSFDYSPRYPDPYYLDFNQISTQLPGGWAKVPQGGSDFAIIFHYPQTGVTWKKISSSYNPALPIALNVTVNGVNETGKRFNFQVDIDVPAGSIPAGVYYLVVAITYTEPAGTPGPMAAYHEGPILQFFEP